MISGPDQSGELNILDGNDGSITPNPPQNLNGFSALIMYNRTPWKCRAANCFHIISTVLQWSFIGIALIQKMLYESSSRGMPSLWVSTNKACLC